MLIYFITRAEPGGFLPDLPNPTGILSVLPVFSGFCRNSHVLTKLD